jgi:hypothetical protein
MKRVAYEAVAIQVDKLYDFSITGEREIEERCDLIREFIESCGWTTDDFLLYEVSN